MQLIEVLLFYAAWAGVSYHDQNHFRTEHQEIARESWENNPDKHPHRMAHFGSFAFRLKHPLSIFDFGIESYTGNAVFLEAHRQNTVNFSEAGFSTGLLRFGELHMAMILQLIIPLIIFFIGFPAIVADRENGTLKILLTQGSSWKEILVGRSLGLLAFAALFMIPFILTTGVLLVSEDHADSEAWVRLLIIIATYLGYYFILCFVSILISANCSSSKNSLLKLLGIWLFMTVLLPKMSQALGAYFHPTPSKVEFTAAIEEEVVKYGDSHNPDDPYFNNLRDSVLKAHNVTSVTDLPFNYGGLVMSEGERITANIYNKHKVRLLDLYRDQNQLTRKLAVINPYLAVKNLSMALCGTDFESYVDFQHQTEDYRYNLAQTMNELQIKYINPGKVSGSEGKQHVVSNERWKEFPDFQHDFFELGSVLQNELYSIFSIIIWLAISIVSMNYVSKNAKAI
ncbi:MAG: DUF3526 domain-containing protein [Bacteroidota bacterium]